MFSPARPPLTPPRRRKYQRTGNGIPPTQRQWRKGDRESLKLTPPETRGIPQSPSPEGYHSSTNPTSGCNAPPQYSHWSTFSFSESRTAFSFALQKKKWFWPLLGRQKSDFPRKGYAPSVRRHGTYRVRAVSKWHSRQETACRQRLGCGPRRASGKTIPRRARQIMCKTKCPPHPVKIPLLLAFPPHLVYNNPNNLYPRS